MKHQIFYLFLTYLQQFQNMSSDSIRVVCRLRPLNKIEIANQGEECVSYTNKQITIAVGGEENKYNFAFDKIFGPVTQQVEIYKQVAIPVIKSVISGFNGTIFAYGQTGGGKTWTMEGPNHHDAEFKGLIPRTIQGLFQAIAEGDQNMQFVIKCSYIEIYNEKLFDLLDPSKSRLQIKEDKHKGVYIQNCTEINVGSAQQMLKTMDNGAQNRKVAFTGMNQRSSRSHSLFIVYVYQKNTKKDNTKQSKLYFVDLAGSEKVSKTGCQGQQLQQAKNINKSLSCLGNVINALTSQKKQHVPYRDSKLTRVLQQSLGGNSKTTLIINCSMCTYNDKETLSTLRFGYRAKSIKNKAKVNQQKSAKQLLLMLQVANKTISELKLQLGGKMPVSLQQGQNTSMNEQSIAIIEQLRQRIQEYKRQQQQKNKQLKQMQLRVKSILLQLSQTKQNFSSHTDTCKAIFKNIKASLTRLNKYMSRVYIDLEYWINNLIIEGNQQNQQIKVNLDKTFQNIVQFTSYYENQVKKFFNQQENQVQSPENACEQNFESTKNDRSFQKKIKMTYSEPNLICSSPAINQELQMSCIVDKKGQNHEDITNVNSDKVSQQESFTQIQTLLQSLQTKESQRMAIQQLSYKMKILSKQNQQLAAKNQKLIAQNKIIAHKIQQKYEQRLMDLQERVDEYRHIIKQKDNQITNYLKQIEKYKKLNINQKVVSERLKKVIEGNNNLKNFYELEQKLRSLASQRQKLFNQLYNLRSQLDDAQVTINQKQQHIESLKEVMKQLTANKESQVVIKKEDIQKKYNRQVYGTDTPNVVVTIKGGSKAGQLSPSISVPNKQKQSSLRKKVTLNDSSRQDKGNILPYIKGFFS